MRWKITGSVQPLASRPIWPPAGLIQSDQKQVALLKEKAYQAAVEAFVAKYAS